MLRCSVIGHRNFEINDDEIDKLRDIIELLIFVCHVGTFNFTSRSKFVDVVWDIVNELKLNKYPFIKMVAYDCKNESSCLFKDKLKTEQIYSKVLGKPINLRCFDFVVQCKKSYAAGTKAYISRNIQIIDESDICLFYYNKEYKPEIKRRSKRSACLYQPQSGTKIAYEYAKQRKKTIYNFFLCLN